MRLKLEILIAMAIAATFLIGINSMDFTSVNNNSAENQLEENFAVSASEKASSDSDITTPVKVSHSSKNAQNTHRKATANHDVTVTNKCKSDTATVSKTSTEKTSKSKQSTNAKSSEAPEHTHTWSEVTSTRQVKKTREVAWTKCYACGADMTGNLSHIDVHLENHESNVHYGTEYRTEEYYVTETYVSGYRCSCGATK